MKNPTKYKLMILLAIGGLTWAVLSWASPAQSRQANKNTSAKLAESPASAVWRIRNSR